MFLVSSFNCGKRDNFWDAIKYISKNFVAEQNCVCCFQEVENNVTTVLGTGYCGALNGDQITERIPVRTNFHYEFEKELVTVISRSFFSNGKKSIRKFEVYRSDMLINIVPHGTHETIAVINCHQTCKQSEKKADFVAWLFAVILRLSSGGQDARGEPFKPVDALVLAGDLNLRNVYHGKPLHPKYKDKKLAMQLCYVLLQCGLVPLQFDDSRGHEIDYIAVSKNLEEIEKVNLPFMSDHVAISGIYLKNGSLAPRKRKRKWDSNELLSKLVEKQRSVLAIESRVESVVNDHLDEIKKSL